MYVTWKSKFFKILIFSTGRLSISSQLLKLLFFTFYFTWTQFKTVSLFKCLTLSQPWFNRWTLFPKLSHQHLLLIPSFAIIFFKYSLSHTLTHTHENTQMCLNLSAGSVFMLLPHFTFCYFTICIIFAEWVYLTTLLQNILRFSYFSFLSFLLNFFF